ncbi:MAG: hypothetical protein GF317_16940 [Candidatus Lokiarchaeota archaeon]|nr:hypothetical protein [Candidatus Lokiarchaeota archaeon]MBD3201205.1 hypothetical protein [Candidatus Lokiarchaeota archaeon]
MTETSEISQQYQKIIRELHFLNPNKKIKEINKDVKNFLFNSFLNEIEKWKFSNFITIDKIRKDIKKQQLQKSRQPFKLRVLKDDKIKKESQNLKFKKIQSSLNRKEFFDKLDYPGNYSKSELFYINHTDKTYIKRKSFK